MQEHTWKKKAGRLAPLFSKEANVTEFVCLQLLFLALGALSGGAELLFRVRPFGVALAAATTHYFPASALGAAIFSLIVRDYVSLVGLAGVAAVRVGFYFLPMAQSQVRISQSPRNLGKAFSA